ncbi:MAG: hypothetical protein H3Z52_05355 [archaeon]|nr:hypothetical protein [archaeon]MCP8320349.1 hypothetical protein [archaeon]
MTREHFESRKNPYSGCEIPKDSMLIEIMKLVRGNELQEASNLLAQVYGIKGVKIVLDTQRSPASFLVYNFIDEEIILYIENLPSSIEKLWALLLGFFEHLSAIKSWRFHDDPEVSHSKQREEAEQFAVRIMDRYVAMGFIAKRE